MPLQIDMSSAARSSVNSATRWAILVAALALLNASLTFTNVWPTLAVRLTADLSIDLAVCLVVLALAYRTLRPAHAMTRRAVAALWVVLVLWRYGDVTTRSLYGREINLYWDPRFVPDVGAMFAFVAQPWLAVAAIGGLVLLPMLLYVAARWALGRVIDTMQDARARLVMGGVAGALILVSAAQGLGARGVDGIRFAEPVMPTLARAVTDLGYEMTGAGVRALAPPPAFHSSFTHIDGADVLLVFLESYGAVSWDRPEFADALGQARSRFETDIHDTGRGVVSASVESTTFGGESWLAHLSFLSGTEVRDQRTNVRLMAQQRDTLVKAFGRHDYRTVAIMPGLLRGWPEGAFYGFDDIYDLHRLDYGGPPFGWWSVTDQFALARMDALEIAPQPRRPAFIFFPTVSTHAPFTPAPPYQPDWARVLTADTHDAEDLDRAWSDQPDWTNLGPSYVRALEYAYATLGGYLRLRADRDLVMILIGDHQPAGLVSGEGASWNVPVHVIASRPALLERLQQRRFRPGLEPPSPAIASMHRLAPLLLHAFGDEDP